MGIDPAALEIGAETPCRFWAHYELSEKLNGAGNPYKEVITLEPSARAVGPGVTSTSTDPGLAGDASALLDEVRHIRAMLELLPGDAATPTGDERPTLCYANGEPVSENPAEHKAFRAWVKGQTQA